MGLPFYFYKLTFPPFPYSSISCFYVLLAALCFSGANSLLCANNLLLFLANTIVSTCVVCRVGDPWISQGLTLLCQVVSLSQVGTALSMPVTSTDTFSHVLPILEVAKPLWHKSLWLCKTPFLWVLEVRRKLASWDFHYPAFCFHVLWGALKIIYLVCFL